MSRFPSSLKFIILLLAVCIGLLLVIFSVFHRNKAAVVQNITSISPLSYAKEITVDASNRNKFITNLLGSEYLNFLSTTKFYSTDKVGKDVMMDITNQLTENTWQLESDWGHQNALIRSNWKKGDLEFTVLLFDDLDSFGIGGLDKNYGIRGLAPKQTLFVIHTIDKTVPAR